jgi:rhamnosyltransferase subunit B
MRVLIACLGSLGDTLPFVAIGKALQARGHEVFLFANEVFQPFAAGLPLVPTGRAAEAEALLKQPDVTHHRHGWPLVAESFMRALPPGHQAMSEQVVPGQTVAVGSTFAFATRLLGETHGVPTATVHLSPSVFRSLERAPRITPLGLLGRLPHGLQRGFWWLMDRFFLDPLLTAPLNDYRVTLGLPPVRRACDAWLQQADLTLAMFPPWFAPPQSDWPAGVVLTGFPLYDHGDVQSLSPELSAFLSAGDAPIGFTTGTANASSHEFFAASLAACQRLGRRGVLIARDVQWPHPLPSDVLHVPYAPFRTLLPRLAALVHHGGIGTTSQALLAGVPQLVRPMGYDQFDNAHHLVTLGVARQLLPRHYRPAAVANALRYLIEDQPLKTRCRTLANRLVDDDAVARAADAVEALAAKKAGAGGRR